MGFWDRILRSGTSAVEEGAANAAKFNKTRSILAGDIERAHVEAKLENEYRRMGAHKSDSNFYTSGYKPNFTMGGSFTPPAGTLGKMDILKSVSESGVGSDMLGGAMKMGGYGLLGSVFYGGASIAAPNNVDVQNPVSNVFKAGVVGMGMGALYGASKGLLNPELARMVKPELASKFANVQAGAQMVSKAFENRLMIGALGAAAFAGSGDINLTKPVNPVY